MGFRQESIQEDRFLLDHLREDVPGQVGMFRVQEWRVGVSCSMSAKVGRPATIP